MFSYQFCKVSKKNTYFYRHLLWGAWLLLHVPLSWTSNITTMYVNLGIWWWRSSKISSSTVVDQCFCMSWATTNLEFFFATLVYYNKKTRIIYWLYSNNLLDFIKLKTLWCIADWNRLRLWFSSWNISSKILKIYTLRHS